MPDKKGDVLRHFSTFKVVEAVAPAVIKDDAAYTATVIDTAGFRNATIYCHFGSIDFTVATLKITECATSGGSYTDITGTIVGTANNITGAESAFPSASDDNTFMVFDIDMDSHERFLQVSATAGDGAAGTYMSAFCVLSRFHGASLETAASRGGDEVLRV